MGLNGAFLTGDLFNLFVFFEVLLAASYGLLLHGWRHGARPGRPALHRREPRRRRSLFLIGVALIYGIAGTLNMADLAGRAARACRRTTARCSTPAPAILGVAFLVKAGELAAQLLAAGHLLGRERARRRRCSRS